MSEYVKVDAEPKKKIGWFSSIAVGGVLAFYAFLGTIVALGWQDQSLKALWDGLEGPGRAAILSSLITALGLLTSAVVLPFVFKDRVKSLDDMVRKTEKDLAALSGQTKSQLDALTNSFRQELEDLRENSNRQSRHTDSLLDGVYKLVSLQLGGGEITDPDHASKIVAELWERTKIETSDRLEALPRIRELTKQGIRDLRIMSPEYLDKLLGLNAINESEHDMIVRLKKLRLQQSAIVPEQYVEIRALKDKIAQYAGDQDLV